MTEFDNIAAATGALTGAVLIGVAALRKSLTQWSQGRNEAAKAEAETDIVEQLRVEVSRLATQNDKLATLVNKLQLELAEVRAENAELKAMLEKFRRDSKFGDDFK